MQSFFFDLPNVIEIKERNRPLNEKLLRTHVQLICMHTLQL